MVDLNLVRKQVKEEPHEEIADEHKTDPVMQDDRRPERQQIDQSDVTYLKAGYDHHHESERVGPVPDPDGERVNVDSWHCVVPFALGHRRRHGDWRTRADLGPGCFRSPPA